MEIVGISGYILATVAYFIFVLLLIAAKNTTFSGRIIFFSALFMFSGALIAVAQTYYVFSLKYVLIFENVKLFLWLLLVSSTQYNFKSLRDVVNHKISLKQVLIVFAMSSLCWISSIYGFASSKYIFLLFLVLNLWVLVAFEQLYRNSDAKAKWALWPLVIGLGTASVFDFVIFAQAAMVDILDFNYWYARGFIVTLGMPFFLISTRRMKNWSVNVFISREVVFYSSMLMISGGYLLLLAVAGYAINFLGGEWSDVISIAFLGLGSTVLAALLITEKLRREVKVFITKHFYANKYDYRSEWLKSIEQLAGSDNSNCYQTATEIICSSLNVERGALLKVQSTGQFKTLYHQNFPIERQDHIKLKDVDRFCREQGWIVDVREYTYVEDSYPTLDLDVEFCHARQIDIIVPIFKGEGIYGYFVLESPNERGYLNWEDRDLLFAITKQLSNYLSLNEAKMELAESKQFEAFHRMSAFLVHDLKNVQAQLALINSNAKRHRDNPAFIDDVFETIESATERLEKVLTQLRNKQVVESGKKLLSVNQLIEQVAAQRSLQKPKVSIEIEGDLTLFVDQQEFHSIINHLVQNAQEATADDGWVKIKASKDEYALLIAVVDNGIGMTEEFIQQRLFKPFDTTKGNAGMGIGVYEAKQFVENMGGSLQVTSFVNEGTIFQLTLPND